MESEFEYVVICPLCRQRINSLTSVAPGEHRVDEWMCPPPCKGTRAVFFGPCSSCRETAYHIGRDGANLLCPVCQANHVSPSSREIAEDLTAKIRRLQSTVEDTSRLGAIEGTLRNHNKELEKVHQAIHGLKANINSVSALVTKFDSTFREETKESESRTARMIQVVAADAKESSARQLKDLAIEEQQFLVKHLQEVLLGETTPDGEPGPGYRNAAELVAKRMAGVVHRMKLMDAKIAELRLDVASTFVDAITEGSGRKKEERPLVLSLNFPALADFVQATNSYVLSTVVRHLPELFNRIEADLRLHMHEHQQSGAERPSPHLQMLQELDESFANWQKQNNIVRFPEQPGEAMVPRWHKVIRTVATDKPDQDRLIAEIEQYGYLLRQGENETILQKAEVAVWDCRNRK